MLVMLRSLDWSRRDTAGPDVSAFSVPNGRSRLRLLPSSDSTSCAESGRRVELETFQFWAQASRDPPDILRSQVDQDWGAPHQFTQNFPEHSHLGAVER